MKGSKLSKSWIVRSGRFKGRGELKMQEPGETFSVKIRQPYLATLIRLARRLEQTPERFIEQIVVACILTYFTEMQDQVEDSKKDK